MLYVRARLLSELATSPGGKVVPGADDSGTETDCVGTVGGLGTLLKVIETG